MEKERLRILTERSIALTLLEPTETGLKKSIMDATGIVRSYLKKQDLHNYSQQKQGPAHKVQIPARLLTDNKVIESITSLYRPNTKKGDPRIWFSKLKEIAKPYDMLAVIAFRNILYVFNLSELPVEHLLLNNQSNPLQDLVRLATKEQPSAALELLGKLREIAQRGRVKAMLDADTAIGRTLETVLGIPINSSKSPDYKGIEIKTFRSGRNNRKNLFAQVPDWKLSKLKSSSEILDAFGYWRGGDFKLYCTVSTSSRNAQGLQLRVDHDLEYLYEHSDQPSYGDFAVWTLEKLHERLLEKHKETFWVAARSIKVGSEEYFQFERVEHTKQPMVSQFNILLEQGIITLDHLIKRKPSGRISEKGPIFKITQEGLSLLFPPSKQYDLSI